MSNTPSWGPAIVVLALSTAAAALSFSTLGPAVGAVVSAVVINQIIIMATVGRVYLQAKELFSAMALLHSDMDVISKTAAWAGPPTKTPH